MRKYFTEFSLCVSTAYKMIIPLEYLDQVDDGHKYHIYFILSCEKIFIEPDSIAKTTSGIALKLYKLVNGKKSYYPNGIISLGKDIDHNEITIECDFPYTTLSLKTADGVSLLIDSQAILNYQKFHTTWAFKVLYVGQSYGKDGSKLAQDRLLNHSTLQRVLTDYNSKYPDKRIYIFLLELNPMLNTSMDGINNSYSVSESSEKIHFDSVLNTRLKMNQIVNITEAAIINYFKPTYNINFVENFPDVKHKGYAQYFDLDYHSLIVELDLDFDIWPSVHFYSDANSIKSSLDFIQYDLHNDPNRASMYALFSEKTV